MPVTISGKTESGEAFEEKTRTVVINCSGCKLRSEQTFNIGDQVTLGLANGKRSMLTTVAWLGERKGKQAELGVDFNAPDPTFWGVRFPDDPNVSSADVAPKSAPAPSRQNTPPDAPVPSAPSVQAMKSATRADQNTASTAANVNSLATVAKPEIAQVSPAIPPVVSALTPAINPPPHPLVPSEAAPAKRGPTPVAQGDLASLSSSAAPGGEEESRVITIRRPQISISDDGIKSLGGDLLLGMVQHLVREAFQEVMTQVLEDFDQYCTRTIERAKNAALTEMQDHVRNAVTQALQPALEAGVQGARSHLDNAARQITTHHAQRLEASMQQALENTEKALEERVSDYDQRLSNASAEFCQDLARRLHHAAAA